MTNGVTAGGLADIGALKFMKVAPTNLTNDTATGKYK
jgi:hypothetical protein